MLLACALLAPSLTTAQQPVPALTARVVDTAQILTTGEAGGIETQLARIEQERGSQIVVLLVNTTAPEDIASYANRVANAWKIGRRDVGDGVLIVIANEDRKLRIEVAKSLEGAIPDLAAKQIISTALAPALKQGQYAQGIEATIEQLDKRISGENLPAPASSKDQAESKMQTLGFHLSDLMIFLFFAVPIGGAVAKGIFGNKLGSVITGGAVGGVAFFLTASMIIAGMAFFVAALFTLVSSFGRAVSGRRGHSRGYDGGGWSTGSGGGGGWSSNDGGGFSSGGGGDFGGGGASGDF
ncbi:MAG: YgcG family protein [Burkholderiales bacterium]|nr:MAG: YgcG family protein [Burkholderiales bacterium]